LAAEKVGKAEEVNAREEPRKAEGPRAVRAADIGEAAATNAGPPATTCGPVPVLIPFLNDDIARSFFATPSPAPFACIGASDIDHGSSLGEDDEEDDGADDAKLRWLGVHEAAAMGDRTWLHEVEQAPGGRSAAGVRRGY
jgi:hypothetical protein